MTVFAIARRSNLNEEVRLAAVRTVPIDIVHQTLPPYHNSRNFSLPVSRALASSGANDQGHRGGSMFSASQVHARFCGKPKGGGTRPHLQEPFLEK